MPISVFETNLLTLNLAPREKPGQGGVMLTSKLNTDPDDLSPQEFFALETANHFGADAVYFRFFDDGRESIPQIYIYDNTDGRLTGAEALIHKKVWSGCVVPLFIIINKFDVKIFDARDKVQIAGDELRTHAIDTIRLTGTAVSSFSSQDLATGLFWEDRKYENKFKYNTSAYKELIDGLKKVYEDFQVQSGLDHHVALKLLVQCLLIKYLEERDEQSGYFAKSFFKNHFKCNSFCEVIANGKLLDLLDKLAINFNGKIFEWNEETEKAARNTIRQAKVRKLAEYLDGNTSNDQYVLWRLYSFSHLPVELISSVYEELLGKGKKDTVYTPDMVASTLIDECMPLKNPKRDFRLIDVSCGSGIFLVKAYKRIVQWWRYEQWKETGHKEKPDVNTLKTLLKQSIYGIDIQGDAARLTVFSLALALLDDLDPKTIWTKLKFEDLSNNIITRDFFEVITLNSLGEFDLVIGNPPFNPPNSLSNGKYYKSLSQYGYTSKIEVPDYNVALLFLSESMKLLKSKGLLCLIQPSGPLLYQEDQSFKREMFSKFNLLQVIDFTRLGDVLWGKADVATAAVFFQNFVPDENDVAHITVQRTQANLKKLFLEIDHYDFHHLSKKSVIENPYVWKAGLSGGGRITGLVEKISKLPSIGDYLGKKSKSEGWKIGEGFIEKGGDSPEPAKYITGQRYLPAKAFTEKGIDWSSVGPCEVKSFHRPREKEIYTPPHLLIKETFGKKKLLVHFLDEYMVFRDSIIGIHSPEKDKSSLVKLYEYLINYSDILRFYILCTSSKLSVNRATVLLKEDLMRLPYPEDLSALKVTTAEGILIKDALENYLNSEGILEENANEDLLSLYSMVFCKTLNSVYKSLDREFRLIKILDTGKYFAMHFGYSMAAYSDGIQYYPDLDSYVEATIPNPSRDNRVTIQKVLKYYSRDNVIWAKPKQVRYWQQSIALRDADETFRDYVKTGY